MKLVLSPTLTFLAVLAGVSHSTIAVARPAERSSPDFDYPVIWSNGDVHLSGQVCVDGFVHANQTLYDTHHLSCGTWDFGYQVDPQPLRTAPDAFPGATYYYVLANDGPGRRDTLFIKDRNWTTVRTFISGVSDPESPHSDFRWAYEREAGGVLTVEVDRASEVLDQETGAFPRLGTDSTVVINFGGRTSYMRHSATRLTLKENASGTGDEGIRSTVINARHAGAGRQPLDSFSWSGGLTLLKGHVQFTPRLGLALLVKSLEAGSQVEIGTPRHPALTYVVGDGDFSSGQASIQGQLIALDDLYLGGGFNAVYDSGFEDDLPGWIIYDIPLRLDIPGGVEPPEGPLPVAGASPSVPPHRAGITRVGPNPFRSTATIEFTLPRPGRASLTIFDAQGRVTRSLIERDMESGAHSMAWDGKTDRGVDARSGIYFVRLVTDGTSTARRLVRVE